MKSAMAINPAINAPTEEVTDRLSRRLASSMLKLSGVASTSAAHRCRRMACHACASSNKKATLNRAMTAPAKALNELVSGRGGFAGAGNCGGRI